MRSISKFLFKPESKRKQYVAKRDRAVTELVKADRPTVFDVGANEGQSIQLFSDLFNSPRIHAFAPDPTALQKATSLSNDRTSVCPLALDETVGKQTFF